MKPERHVLYYNDSARIAVSVPDLSKSADVKAALQALWALDERLPDAIHDWLIVGKGRRAVCRDYGLSATQLTDAKKILQEALRDYAK